MREIVKWVIVPTGVSSMLIEGRCAKTGEFVTTQDIQRRLGNYRVVTVGGVCYQLRGHLDRDACSGANIPLHILDKFKNGVPPNWKRIIHGWSPTAPGKHKRRLKRRTSARHGSSTMTRPVSVPGTPRSDRKLYGRHKYNLFGEQAEMRSLPRVSRVTREQRASQAERGEMSGNHVANMIEKNQPPLKELRVVVEPLPKFVSVKGNIRKFANKQISSTPGSVERRSTRSSASVKKGTLNQKRYSNCTEAPVVARKSSLSKQEEDLMSIARAKTEHGPVLVTKGTFSSEVASCSTMQPPAPKLQSDIQVPARETSGVGMVTRRRSASCPGLLQLAESSKAQVHSPGLMRGLREASRSKYFGRKMAAERGASERCKEKKRMGSTTIGNPAMKTQRSHTPVCAAATTITRSSLRITRGGSLWSAEQGYKKGKSKQSRGRSLDRAEWSRKHPYMDPLKLHPGKRKGKAASISSSPPRRELRSTRSSTLGCTRSGCRYARESAGLVSRNLRLASASSARRKLDLTSPLNSGDSSQEFEDSPASVRQKKVGGLKQHDLAKCVAKQTAVSSPKRLSRNRAEPGIYSEAKALSAKETVKKHSSAIQGRRRTRSLTVEKENEAVQAKRKDTNSSQPKQVSTSTATKASLLIAEKGTLKQKVQTFVSYRNKRTRKQDTFTALKPESQAQELPASAVSKGESSKMQASHLGVASMPATKEQLRKADEKRTPHALHGPPIPDTAESLYPARKTRRSIARADIAKAGHASGTTATQPLDALSPKIPKRALKRKCGASAEKRDHLTVRKKPKKDGKVQETAASPCAVKMGGPRLVSTAVRSRKRAGTPKLSHTSKTAERLLAAGAQKEASRCEAHVNKKSSAKECLRTSVNKRPEAREARMPPARSRCQRAATARANFKLDQRAGSSKAPANMPSGSAATEKPNEGDKGQKPLQLLYLCTPQVSASQNSELKRKARSSKGRACTTKVGHATEASAMQPVEASLPEDKVVAFRQKCKSGAEEPNTLLGQKIPNGHNYGAEKLDAPTGRGKPRNANKARKPPPSGSPEVGSDQHLEPTLKEVPRKKDSKPNGQTAGTGSATEEVQQKAVQCRARTTKNTTTEKQDGSTGQNEPRKADKILQSPESVHHALERKMSGLGLVPAKSSQMSDIGQGSKFTASDQVLAATAQKGILKQTRRTSGTENVGQTVQRKPNKGRAKRGEKVQKPASSDAKIMHELAPEAGPSRAPTEPRKGGNSQRPASSDAEGNECEAGPSRTPASGVGQAPKTSAGAQFTAALLAITARKGTKKRKAQVKQLTEALAARDACDIYGATGAPVGAVGDSILGEDPWAESDLRASSMVTPPPNSPHLSPGKSCFSWSSDHSVPMSTPPPFANAILQEIRGKKAPARPPPSTPKLAPNRKKRLSVSAWAKELRVLEEAIDRDQIRANCAESSSEEGSDTESSGSARLPPLLL